MPRPRDPIPATQHNLELSLFSMGHEALSGALLGLGYGLLQGMDGKNVWKRTLGGACFTCGLYLFSPTSLRQMWNAAIPSGE